MAQRAAGSDPGTAEVIMAGHFTGGMSLLSVPEPDERLAAVVLVGSAPHAGWRPAFARWAEAHHDPGLAEQSTCGRNPHDATPRALTPAAARWNFTPDCLAAGRAPLEGLPRLIGS
ncbi:hypothetical protein ACIQWN_38425 [Streptomyces vinaceus]|uniref:hypothetical protein n=1 Tax=Streptomyces vinaceus TaxID=1960 RepID=UPI003817531B